MFTGIVEDLGEIVQMKRLDQAAQITIRSGKVTEDIGDGESIAVNGVCLTVAHATRDTFTADIMLETLSRSSLGQLSEGDQVNLERSVRLQDRLGGHLVQGHVDGVATILDRSAGEVVRIGLPAGLGKYVVEKGSITVDGISLTVSAVTGTDFEVSLIPETIKRTTLGVKQAGDTVNLEVDVLAKYVASLLAEGAR